MNVFILHAHPEPKSFNGGLFHSATETLQAAGHAVRVSDLYAMGRVYGYGRIYETGRMRGKRALLSLTTGGPEAA